ncbi:methyl-accepting chemotaxis protein [Natronocella acetinitrilica]|uniref:Methyl-accepting chemotaxis protein n=1 Tax=Natronocella acetinitrilica TaxID=414046 RepID=A0AAE3G2C1_9GAMM|nr:methyl-accepting chemotaxis protein [Natronocella acetinitrilica]MCP1673754.1 methyl-accepting chemotaxis protein [Natronocella acetinitrilica]
MSKADGPGKTTGMGFGTRLTLMIVALVLGSIVAITAIVYVQYRDSHTQAVVNRLAGMGEGNAQSFMDWLTSRQDEMRFLASLDAARQLDREQLNHLLERIAASQGHYDTIFVVGPDGRGIAGVSYDGAARVLSAQEAANFNVPDRAWFQQAISGQDTFSQPVVSRATGNRVSTVAIPIRDGNRVVAVMRGAVDLDQIMQRVSGLSLEGQSEIYLLDRDGRAVTPVESAGGADVVLETAAAVAVAAGDTGTGLYRNAAGTPVVGSYNDIPLLGWGLVLEVNQHEAMAAVLNILWLLLGIAGAILVVSVLAALGVVRSVTRTLGGDPGDAARKVELVAQGDLTTPLGVREGDNDSLLASIGGMQGNLRKMLGQISDYSDELASAATELSQISQETDHRVQQQHGQINNAATAMNEMASTVEEVARNTQAAADGAEHATERAGAGRRVVTETANAIQQLAEGVAGATEVITALKKDTDTIGSVLQVIRSVAEQTNLLALNASIEAARAGENGRGFTVVAEEVRTLASRTQQSTAEIQAVIDQLQNRADEAVQVMQASGEQARRSVDQAGEAAEALDGITAAVNRINDMIQQIASATEEQTAVAQEINSTIHEINDGAEQSARSIVQSTEAVDSLARLAEQLRGQVRQFRV